MSGGDITLGTQTSLAFDATTIEEARMMQVMSFTGVDKTCEVADYDNWATDSLMFAGVSAIRAPYKALGELVEARYAPVDTTIAYAVDETQGSGITVYNNCIVQVLPAETITSGQQIMFTDVANHSASHTHDGMVSPSDATQIDEVAAVIGIARTGGVASSVTTHVFDSNDMDEANHPAIDSLLWR